MLHRIGILALLASLGACGSSSSRSSTVPRSSSGTVGSRSGSTAGSPPFAPSRRHVACGPGSARSIAASAVARVYSQGTEVYGCSSRGHRSYLLGQQVRCIRATRVGPVVVSGELAAYGAASCGVDTGSAAVVVRQLRTGFELRDAPATTKRQPPESFRSVTSLVLARDGSVAWIGVGRSVVRHTSDIEVQLADAHGQSLLDSGASIGPRSLRLRGSVLSWKHGASTRHTKLR